MNRNRNNGLTDQDCGVLSSACDLIIFEGQPLFSIQWYIFLLTDINIMSIYEYTCMKK